MPKFAGKVIGEVVSEGPKSFSLPPTIQIGFDALENLEASTDELYENLLTLRVLLQNSQENAYAIGNKVILGC